MANNFVVVVLFFSLRYVCFAHDSNWEIMSLIFISVHELSHPIFSPCPIEVAGEREREGLDEHLTAKANTLYL